MKPNTPPTPDAIASIDLCAGEVRVTRKGLLRLAQIATFRARCDCETYLREIQDSATYGNPYIGIAAAENLARAGTDLALSLKFLNAFDSFHKGERDVLTVRPDVSDDANL